MKMRTRIMLERPAVLPVIRRDELAHALLGGRRGQNVPIDEDRKGRVWAVRGRWAVVDLRILGWRGGGGGWHTAGVVVDDAASFKFDEIGSLGSLVFARNPWAEEMKRRGID